MIHLIDEVTTEGDMTCPNHRVRRKVGIEFQPPDFHSIAFSSISSFQKGRKINQVPEQ